MSPLRALWTSASDCFRLGSGVFFGCAGGGGAGGLGVASLSAIRYFGGSLGSVGGVGLPTSPAPMSRFGGAGRLVGRGGAWAGSGGGGFFKGLPAMPLPTR